ncbi:MAG TPA: endonuclease/exonuclease/phosphatase family protein [bacterium]|nr:endonuclease/exonuclease/phosphatase family protein [bacterium]HPN45191.1 endonuclease/exonuclease/phosphatase family protein [bacterium]
MNYNILVSQYGRMRQDTINLIRHEKADVVFIQEINLQDRDLLRNELLDIYPHQLWSEKFETYNGGVILSRTPFTARDNYDVTTEYMKGHMNLNHAVITVQDQNVHLFNCHLYNSGSTFTGMLFGHLTPAQFKQKAEIATKRHDAEVAILAERILPIDEPIIFAGDFNDTPNSKTYRVFDRYLHNAFAHAGWGLGTTFGYRSLINTVPKRFNFLVFDFLRIDHVFCSHHFNIHSARVLPVDYSDHRPQIIEIELQSMP